MDLANKDQVVHHKPSNNINTIDLQSILTGKQTFARFIFTESRYKNKRAEVSDTDLETSDIHIVDIQRCKDTKSKMSKVGV